MTHSILAIETASMACSVALITPIQCYTRFTQTQNQHTQLLLPMVNALLMEANLELKDLQAVAVGRGPGSFTGVRIAMSAAQGLAYGLNLPIYPISTLEALCAKGLSERGDLTQAVVVPALDARMQEIYAAAYLFSQDAYELVLEEQLLAPGDLLNQINADLILALGSGWDVYFKEIVAQHNEKQIYFLADRFPDALQIGLIVQKQIQQGVQGQSAKAVLPVYLREKVALKPNESKSKETFPIVT